MKEGYLRKRSQRLQRWARRYFILNGSKISYKLKNDVSSPVRGEYDITADCTVTDVVEDSSSGKGKKLYSFWIIWPSDDQSAKITEEKAAEREIIEFSDDDEVTVPPGVPGSHPPSHHQPKDLKDIVQNEVEMLKRQQKEAEGRVESHKTHDQNVSAGAKVAAVALGGALIGGLTAGIGVLPYLALVGIASLAGGGAMYLNYNKPGDSRMIICAESMEEAVLWREAINNEIIKLEKQRRPLLPSSINAFTISSLLDASSERERWSSVGVFEGMRIMDLGMSTSTCAQFSSSSCGSTSICRKAQLVIASTPISCFLALMEANLWPKIGNFRVERTIDDHADEVFVEAASWNPKSKKACLRPFRFSRFWKLDDDGLYLITLKTIEDYSSAAMDVVITVAPRLDHADFDFDFPICLVTVIVQMSEIKSNKMVENIPTATGSKASKANFTRDWHNEEIIMFVNEFLKQNLLELRQNMLLHKFCHTDDKVVTNMSMSEKSVTDTASTVSTASVSAASTIAPSISSSTPSSVASSPRFTSTLPAMNGTPYLGTSSSLTSAAATTSAVATSVSNGTTSSSSSIASVSTSLAPSARKWLSRGTSKSSNISTIQPGLDDVSMSSYERQAALNAQEESAVSNSAPSSTSSSGSRMTFFRRALSPSSGNANSNNDNGSDMNAMNTSSMSPDGKKQGWESENRRPRRFSTRRKSLNANPEVAKLRSSIAAKKYELDRLEKILKRKGASLLAGSSGSATNGGLGLPSSVTNTMSNTLPNVNLHNNTNSNSSGSASGMNGNSYSSNQEGSSLLKKNPSLMAGDVNIQNQQQLLRELESLEQQYLELTGTTYEQQTLVKKVGSFGRFFGGSYHQSMPSHSTHNNTTTNNSSSSSSNSSTGTVVSTPMTVTNPNSSISNGTATSIAGTGVISNNNNSMAYSPRCLLTGGCKTVAKLKYRPDHWSNKRDDEIGNDLLNEILFSKVMLVLLFSLSLFMSFMLSNVI